jgi:hypothetical protein
MRKPDAEVREVVCSETGKPMPKIPLWMADVNVKFVSDEARQRHSVPHAPVELEAARRGYGGSELDEIKDIDVAGDVIDDADADFEDEDADAEPEELADEEFEE